MKNWRTVLGGALAVVIGLIVIGRALVDQFGPATLSVTRWVLSAALAVALLAVWRAGAERWQAPPALIVRIGLLGNLPLLLSDPTAVVKTSPVSELSLM